MLATPRPATAAPCLRPLSERFSPPIPVRPVRPAKGLLLSFLVAAALLLPIRQPAAEPIAVITSSLAILSQLLSFAASGSDPIATMTKQNHEMLVLIHKRLSTHEQALRALYQRIDRLPTDLRQEFFFQRSAEVQASILEIDTQLEVLSKLLASKQDNLTTLGDLKNATLTLLNATSNLIVQPTNAVHILIPALYTIQALSALQLGEHTIHHTITSRARSARILKRLRQEFTPFGQSYKTLYKQYLEILSSALEDRAELHDQFNSKIKGVIRDRALILERLTSDSKKNCYIATKTFVDQSLHNDLVDLLAENRERARGRDAAVRFAAFVLQLLHYELFIWSNIAGTTETDGFYIQMKFSRVPAASFFRLAPSMDTPLIGIGGFLASTPLPLQELIRTNLGSSGEPVISSIYVRRGEAVYRLTQEYINRFTAMIRTKDDDALPPGVYRVTHPNPLRKEFVGAPSFAWAGKTLESILSELDFLIADGSVESVFDLSALAPKLTADKGRNEQHLDDLVFELQLRSGEPSERSYDRRCVIGPIYHRSSCVGALRRLNNWIGEYDEEWRAYEDKNGDKYWLPRPNPKAEQDYFQAAWLNWRFVTRGWSDITLYRLTNDIVEKWEEAHLSMLTAGEKGRRYLAFGDALKKFEGRPAAVRKAIKGIMDDYRVAYDYDNEFWTRIEKTAVRSISQGLKMLRREFHDPTEPKEAKGGFRRC